MRDAENANAGHLNKLCLTDNRRSALNTHWIFWEMGWRGIDRACLYLKPEKDNKGQHRQLQASKAAIRDIAMPFLSLSTPVIAFEMSELTSTCALPNQLSGDAPSHVLIFCPPSIVPTSLFCTRATSPSHFSLSQPRSAGAEHCGRIKHCCEKRKFSFLFVLSFFSILLLLWSIELRINAIVITLQYERTET